MKRGVLFVTCILCFLFSTHAQKQASRWFFGVNAALDFTGGPPVLASGGSYSIPEGSASICKADGQLLFYTDGNTVWNAAHAVMPNGTGLLGGTSSTQSSLIVPDPGDATRYYVFTTDEIGGPNGFKYSIVDMDLDGGSGDVTSKNTNIEPYVTEKLIAVENDRMDGYWILIHKWGNDAFYAYELTAAGLQPPVISHTGIVHSDSIIQNTYGQMKFSMCGDRVAAAMGYMDTVQVFDFDNSTGVVSNPLTIPMNDHVYGIEFSRSSDLLYVSCYDPAATLSQFDLTQATPALIIGSKTDLSATPDIYGLQIATDGVIYVVKSFSQYLGAVTLPDTVGGGCNYIDNAIDLDPGFMGNTAGLGTPNFMRTYLKDSISCGPPPSTAGVENLNGHIFRLYPNPSTDAFNLDLSAVLQSSTQEVQFIVLDYTGKIIETRTCNTGIISFGAAYAPGIYFVQLRQGNQTSTIKMIKS